MGFSCTRNLNLAKIWSKTGIQIHLMASSLLSAFNDHGSNINGVWLKKNHTCFIFFQPKNLNQQEILVLKTYVIIRQFK